MPASFRELIISLIFYHIGIFQEQLYFSDEIIEFFISHTSAYADKINQHGSSHSHVPQIPPFDITSFFSPAFNFTDRRMFSCNLICPCFVMPVKAKPFRTIQKISEALPQAGFYVFIMVGTTDFLNLTAVKNPIIHPVIFYLPRIPDIL